VAGGVVVAVPELPVVEPGDPGDRVVDQRVGVVADEAFGAGVVLRGQHPALGGKRPGQAQRGQGEGGQQQGRQRGQRPGARQARTELQRHGNSPGCGPGIAAPCYRERAGARACWLYWRALQHPPEPCVPPTTTPSPTVPPLAIRAYTATTALGAGLRAPLDALAQRRGGLRRNDFAATAPLDTWIGRVDGLERLALPAQWSQWECRNNRLAWLALQQDGLAQAIDEARERHRPQRVAIVLGTSTASIGATEEAYARLDAEGAFPPDLRRACVHTPHSLGGFVQAATGLRGPCVTVATACSSSAKVFAQAARLIHAGVVDAALVGGVDTLCGSVLFGFNALGLVAAQPCRPFDAAR